MATCKTNCCHRDGLKSQNYVRKVNKVMRSARWNANLMLLLSICGLVALCEAEAQQYSQNDNPLLADRDPRWYSRPGVKDYNPPNPGDKDYR